MDSCGLIWTHVDSYVNICLYIVHEIYDSNKIFQCNASHLNQGMRMLVYLEHVQE